MRLLLLLCVLSLLTACDFFKMRQSSDVLAKVGDGYLYKESLYEVMPLGLSKDDSVQFSNQFVYNWVRNELLLSTAERNLTQDQKDFSKLIQQYRNSLLIYNYEKELVRQKLDTVVSEEEVRGYYQSHPEQFVLNSPMLRLYYVKLPIDVPEKSKFDAFLEDKTRKADLEEFCLRYALHYNLDDTKWVHLDVLKRKLPESFHWSGSPFMAGQIISMEDSLSSYHLKIMAYLAKGDIAPLETEKVHIANLILNQRKMSLIEKAVDQIYQEALRKGDAVIFN